MMRKYFTEGDLISVGINIVWQAIYAYMYGTLELCSIVSKLVDMRYYNTLVSVHHCRRRFSKYSPMVRYLSTQEA